MKLMPLVIALSVYTATLPAAQVAGYGRDGTRIYSDATPPTAWTAKDVTWEAPLPSWGTGSPIVVAGKVFAMCEPCPGRDFPFLVCLDATTGKQLWLKEVDHLAVTGLSEQEQAQVRRDWHDWLEDFYARSRMKARYNHGDEDKATLEAEMKAKGWSYNARWRMVCSDDKRFGGALSQQGMMKKELHAKAGFTVNVSQHLTDFGLNAVGLAYGTPASDGEYIYVNTAFGSVACFDLDGKQRWIAWVKGPYDTEGCIMGRSPILWDAPAGDAKLVLTDIGGIARAFDRATGAVAWTAPIEGQDWAIVSPGILTVDGHDVFWAAACSAFLLPEGKRLTVEGWDREGMQTLVKHDEPDVVFFCGSGEHCGWPDKGGEAPNPPAAVRFALAGETLNTTVLWHGGTLAELNGVKNAKDVFGGNSPWMLCYEGRFYHKNGGILDALTGKLIAGTLDPKAGRRGGGAVPQSGHLLCLAGGHVYGFDGTGKNKKGGEPDLAGTCEVFTVDGTKVAGNPVPYAGLTPEQKDMWVACSGRPELVGFGVGNTFTFAGSAIFFRSYTSIICIGGGR